MQAAARASLTRIIRRSENDITQNTYFVKKLKIRRNKFMHFFDKILLSFLMMINQISFNDLSILFVDLSFSKELLKNKSFYNIATIIIFLRYIIV